jgi:RNA polymerase sigma-70 factor (ECF subfamily)
MGMTPRPVAEIDDATLLIGVQRRDEAAFEMLYPRHAPAVHAVVFRSVKTSVVADEITQTAFMRLWERSTSIQTTGLRLRSWLLTVAMHAITDHERRQRPTVAIDDVPHPVAPDKTDQRTFEIERKTELRAAVDQLPDDQRRAVNLAYYGGLTQVEIAEVLDQPLGGEGSNSSCHAEASKHARPS